MTIQTRLSGLLFFLLLGLCAGSALVVREALQASTRAQTEQLRQLQLASEQTAASDAARLGARSLQALIAARLSEVSARTEALAASPGPAEALTATAPELPRRVNATPAATAAEPLRRANSTLAATAPEPLRRVKATLAAARDGLRFLQLIDSSGQLVEPPVSPETPYVRPPFSLLEPPALATTVPLQALLSQALKGTPVASLEAFSPDLLNHLSPDSTTAPSSAQPALILLAMHPVPNAEGQPMGAVMGGVDLSQDSNVLSTWQRQLALEGIGAALLLEGQRIATVGEGLEPGISLPADVWKALQLESEQRIVEPGAALVRLALRNSREQSVGAVEVRVPIRSPELEDTIRSGISRHEQLFQNSLSMIGTLGIIALIAGILVSRVAISPLIRLSRRAEQISTGRLEASFKDMAGKDEIGELARSLERMRVSLKKLMERQQKSLEDDASSGAERTND